MPPVTTGDEHSHFFSTSDVISFDQNWHNLHSTSAEGNDFSNEAQIRVTSTVDPELCTKMLRNLGKKLRAKFPATTRGYFMAKIARLYVGSITSCCSG